jgi:hypothetical protein
VHACLTFTMSRYRWEGLVFSCSGFVAIDESLWCKITGVWGLVFFLMVFDGISYSVSSAELHEGLLCICSHLFFSGITFGVRGVEQFFLQTLWEPDGRMSRFA